MLYPLSYAPLMRPRQFGRGRDLQAATRRASELQANVRHGQVRRPLVRVEHGFMLASLARGEDRSDAVLAHVGQGHRLDGPAVLVTGAALHRHGGSQ
jgi:hypothetical protein